MSEPELSTLPLKTFVTQDAELKRLAVEALGAKDKGISKDEKIELQRLHTAHPTERTAAVLSRLDTAGEPADNLFRPKLYWLHNPFQVNTFKPVIYLYPQRPLQLSIELKYGGHLAVSYPEYDKIIGGWNVTAFPNGKLINSRDGSEYSYLFWEGD